MKHHNKLRKLDGRIKAFEAFIKGGAKDSGVRTRISSGGYRKPGSIK